MTNLISWDRTRLAFLNNGRAIEDAAVQGAADAVAKEARAQLRILADRMQAGALTLQEGYDQSKALSKILVAAETALARGGWDELRPSDWANMEARVLELWEGRGGKFSHGGIRKVFEDASRGFFGQDLQRRGFNNWVTRPADQGFAVYENERTVLHKESGFAFATRIRGATDGCPTCVSEDGVKRPIDEVVPIGESECGSRCRCAIIYSRD